MIDWDEYLKPSQWERTVLDPPMQPQEDYVENVEVPQPKKPKGMFLWNIVTTNKRKQLFITEWTPAKQANFVRSSLLTIPLLERTHTLRNYSFIYNTISLTGQEGRWVGNPYYPYFWHMIANVIRVQFLTSTFQLVNHIDPSSWDVEKMMGDAYDPDIQEYELVVMLTLHCLRTRTLPRVGETFVQPITDMTNVHIWLRVKELESMFSNEMHTSPTKQNAMGEPAFTPIAFDIFRRIRYQLDHEKHYINVGGSDPEYVSIDYHWGTTDKISCTYYIMNTASPNLNKPVWVVDKETGKPLKRKHRRTGEEVKVLQSPSVLLPTTAEMDEFFEDEENTLPSEWRTIDLDYDLTARFNPNELDIGNTQEELLTTDMMTDDNRAHLISEERMEASNKAQWINGRTDALDEEVVKNKMIWSEDNTFRVNDIDNFRYNNLRNEFIDGRIVPPTSKAFYRHTIPLLLEISDYSSLDISFDSEL